MFFHQANTKTIYLTCDEYLVVPILESELIGEKKCTFSYIRFEAFDEVNISSAIVKELDYESDEYVETDASHSIEVVEFINAQLPHLPKELFNKFQNLKTLSCDGVNLNSLSKADFRMALKLEHFSCNSNFVRMLGKMLFNGSKRLQILDLSINKIEDIDRTTFFGLESLKKLMLYDNKLKTLSEDVFEDLISLEEINLSSNQLTVVGEKLFANCKLLNFIYLNDNRIQQISDKSLLKIVEIKFLQLSNNELSNLELNISASALYANHNVLKTVRLKSIGYLSFFNNSIYDVDFEDKGGVLSLNLSTNKLKSLENFSAMMNVKSLDLSFNDLGSLNVSSFLDMPQLNILNLQSTNLSEIDFGLFTHQTYLEQLDLSYNRLGKLDLSKLTPLKALTTLFIEGNNIFDIDYESIKMILPNLKLFGLTDNPFRCEFLSSLVTSLHTHEIELYHLVTEKTTSNVEGIACSVGVKANEQTNHEDKSLLVKSIKHHQLLNDDNEMRAISEKFEVVLRHVNESSQRFVTKNELINELNLMKNLLASLKHANHSENITISNVKRVANDTLFEAMMLQKFDYDEKINGLKVKLESVEQSIDEIRNQLKFSFRKTSEPDADGKQQFSKIQSPPTDTSDDSVMKLMITVIFVIVCGFTIVYITKLFLWRNSGKIVRRAYSESGTLNENIL